MILMRMNRVLGACEIVPYSDTKLTEGGWFPINSVQFGFNPKGDDSAGKGNGKKNGKDKPKEQPKTKDAEKKDELFTSLEISKNVDISSVTLMRLAMECRRKQGQTDEEMNLKADIHFIGAVSIEETSHTFAFLRIHLDKVEVKQWSISGSGDERPSETVTLGYDMVAMCYQPTPDAKIKTPKLQFGWNQKENDKWVDYITKFFPNFPD